MTIPLRACLVAAIAGLPLGAAAQGYGPSHAPRDVEVTGSVAGRGYGQQPLRYDTGGDNDRQPQRPAYQQGGGQQTGGPARNLIPGDDFTLSPR